MPTVRVIPVLLLRNGGLVKSVKFANYVYIGDPINAVRIFNEKEVNELILLDIEASRNHHPPNIPAIKDIVSEAFMPIAYGGGLNSLNQVAEVLYAGVEKVIFNSAALLNPELITQTAEKFGSSSVVVSIDIKKTMLSGYKVFGKNGTRNMGIDPVKFAKQMEDRGAGEIMLMNIDKDGTMSGYDTDNIGKLSAALNIPLIAAGGAGKFQDFQDAVNAGASAVAGGSFFVFHGRHRAVLISYPEKSSIKKLIK